jgi:hypothetical protein
VGPSDVSALIRSRYDARSLRLRSLMRSVTSRTREFNAGMDMAGALALYEKHEWVGARLESTTDVVAVRPDGVGA